MTHLLPLNRTLMSSTQAWLLSHAPTDDIVVTCHRCQDLRQGDEAIDLGQRGTEMVSDNNVL